MEDKLYATACAKSLRVSPTKVRLLVDLVRGKSVGSAISILKNCQSPIKEDILKVLNSAIANAVKNSEVDADTLYVQEIYVNQGSTLKRFRARAKGSGNRILKRTSHIHVKVAVKE